MPVSFWLPIKKEYKEVYYIEGLFLGKKSYFDLLEYVDDNGKEHNIHDDLARMNGFPTSCIGYYAKGNNCQYYMFIQICMIISLSKLN